jgi:hypothetical protein
MRKSAFREILSNIALNVSRKKRIAIRFHNNEKVTSVWLQNYEQSYQDQINEKSLVKREINFLPPSHFKVMRKLPNSKITRGTSTQLKKYETVSIS